MDRPHSARVDPFAGSNRTYYYVQGDAPGTVLGLVDANATVAATYQVDVWGQPVTLDERGLQGWAQPYLFAGRTYDRETGLYYNRARYYDPAARRFLSEDPIGLAGGVNLYAYAGNDPVNYGDPSGTASKFFDDGWEDWPFSLESLWAMLGGGGGGGGGGGSGGGGGAWQPAQPPKLPEKRLACTGRAYVLAGNRANVGKQGFPGVTVTDRSAAVIPRQFTGAVTGGPFMRAIGASTYGTVTAPDGRTQSFRGLTQPIGYAKLGTAVEVQNMIMARAPGALVLEIVGGKDFGTKASVDINTPDLGQGCPVGTH